MPQRPSKKAKPQPNAKTPGSTGDAAGVQADQQRYREKTTKAIIGKFQGRKSV